MSASRIRRAPAAPLLAAPLSAFAFPDKPIEWVVPYPAGGGTDVVARTLAEQMGKSLDATIVVNNKPGAATNIAADYVAKAKADGHVVLSADTATLAANPSLYAKLTYSAERDFAPVGLMARFPMILVVHPSVPAKNLNEFVDTASGCAHVTAGMLRPLGVASPKRVKNFETIPTLAEQGLKGFEAYAWQGLVVPAATPKPVVDQLSKALLAALDATAVKARFQTLGLEAIPSTPREMADYARVERDKWREVIRAANIKLD